MVISLYNHQSLKKRRQNLRVFNTESEKVLWRKIRDRQVNSLKFYRQYSIGRYILDFYCPKIRLAIELDGGSHNNKIEYDKERENFLIGENIYVLRFNNVEVLKDVKNVIDKIKNSEVVVKKLDH